MMYTDWNKLRMYYKEEDGWSGMIQTIAEVIETFDCAINVTDHREAGVYIDKQTYETNILKNNQYRDYNSYMSSESWLITAQV